MYWTKKKMESHAKQYSQGYRGDLTKGTKYTFWSKDFDSMAKKTMLRQLISKYGIMSTELEKAFTNDMSLIKEDGSNEYVDNEPEIVPIVPNVVDIQEDKEENPTEEIKNLKDIK